MIQRKRLPNYIRSARKKSGLTQRELAYLLGGRGGKRVSRFERFECHPTLPVALGCHVALGLAMNELFAGVYEESRELVIRRAKVLEMQLRRQPSSREIERKRETLRKIIDFHNGQQPSNEN